MQEGRPGNPVPDLKNPVMQPYPAKQNQKDVQLSRQRLGRRMLGVPAWQRLPPSWRLATPSVELRCCVNMRQEVQCSSVSGCPSSACSKRLPLSYRLSPAPGGPPSACFPTAALAAPPPS